MSSNESLLRAALLVLIALLVLPVLMMLVMMPMMGFTGWSHMWGPGMWDGGGGVGGWVAVLLMMAIPLVLVIGLGYAVYRLLTQNGERTDNALEELRMAYARGDLSDEEFEKRRDRLQRER